MSKQLLMLAVSVVVAVLMVGSILLPIVSDAQKQASVPVTFDNSTYNSYVGTYDIRSNFTIENSNVVDGEALIDSANTANRLVFTDTFYVTYRSSGAWQIISADGVSSGSDTLSCTTSGNVATFTSSSLGSLALPYSVAYVFAGEDGEYIINSSFTHSQTVYLSNINRMFLATNQTVDGNTYFVTIKDGKVTSGSTEGTITYDSDSVPGVTGLQIISDLVANINGADVNLAILLVPASEIGYEPTDSSSLIGIIPILVIVGLVVACVVSLRPRE